MGHFAFHSPSCARLRKNNYSVLRHLSGILTYKYHHKNTGLRNAYSCKNDNFLGVLPDLSRHTGQENFARFFFLFQK